MNTTAQAFRLSAFLGRPFMARFQAEDVNGDTSGWLAELEIYFAPGKSLSVKVPGRAFVGPWDALEDLYRVAFEFPTSSLVNYSTTHENRAALLAEIYGQEWHKAAAADLEEIAHRAWNERRTLEKTVNFR